MRDRQAEPEGAVDGLRLFYSGVPIFGTLLAMWIMRNYDLDEARADRPAEHVPLDLRADLDPIDRPLLARLDEREGEPAEVGATANAAD